MRVPKVRYNAAADAVMEIAIRESGAQIHTADLYTFVLEQVMLTYNRTRTLTLTLTVTLTLTRTL